MTRLDAQLRYDIMRAMGRAGGADIHHIATVAHMFEWDDGSLDSDVFDRACRFIRIYAAGATLREACEKSGYSIVGVWPCDSETLRTHGNDRRRAG